MRRSASFFVFLVLAAALVAFQVGATIYSTHRTESVLQQLESFKAGNLNEEKVKQETIALRIENERKSLIWTSVIASFSGAVAILVAISGLWVGIHQYFDTRNRERLDRGATDLNYLWNGLTDNDGRRRTGSIVGLQHFLSKDKTEYHDRVIAGLALAGRTETDEQAIHAVTHVLEKAFRAMRPSLLRSMSWQGLKAPHGNFSSLDLKGFDFRDSSLVDTNFVGANLCRARFTAARLNGADFTGADISGCDFQHADLAGAKFHQANLQNADLRHAKILDADFRDADLAGAHLSIHAMNWSLAKNWRSSKMDSKSRSRLIERYGQAPSPPRILMLAWEMPPFVSGGAWTAMFHLVKNLRTSSALDVVIMVPWAASKISKLSFGNEVEIIALGLGDEREDVSSYGAYALGYDQHDVINDDSAARPSLGELAEEFAGLALEAYEEGILKFDLIHAHDWMTFQAAESLSRVSHRPWTAHYHSTERDRRPTKPDPNIIAVEERALSTSSHIITPSNVSKRRLNESYNAPDKITVVHNSISFEKKFEPKTGSFRKQRVVFLGRITEQKGPDIFIEIIHLLKANCPKIECVMYGQGDYEQRVAAQVEKLSITPIEVKGAPDVPDWQHANAILAIEPILRDEGTGEVERLGSVPANLVSGMAQRLLAEGFTAFPIPFQEPYTHRVRLAASGAEYLVRDGMFPSYEMQPPALVRLAGELSWFSRTRAFKDATVLVVPSRSEPFGMVVLEAMICGVPVAVTKYAGVVEAVKPALALDFNDREEAAESILQLLKDKEKWTAAVEEQSAEISRYRSLKSEESLYAVWKSCASSMAPSGQEVTPVA